MSLSINLCSLNTHKHYHIYRDYVHQISECGTQANFQDGKSPSILVRKEMVGFTAKRFKNPQKERQTLELTDTKVLNDKFYLESKEMVIISSDNSDYIFGDRNHI